MTGIIKRSKYGSTSCRCLQGHTHRSRGEAGHCNALRDRQRKREFYAYAVERKFSIDVNGVHICSHYPDFTLLDKDMNIIGVEEFKGFGTDTWVLKMKLFKALYPAIPYKVIRARGVK